MHRVAELPDVNDVGRATGRHDPHLAGGHDTVDVRFALHYVCRAGPAVAAVDVTQRRLVGATGGRYADSCQAHGRGEVDVGLAAGGSKGGAGRATGADGGREGEEDAPPECGWQVLGHASTMTGEP